MRDLGDKLRTLQSLIRGINFEASLQLPISIGKMLVASYLQSKYFLQQDKFISQMKPINISLPTREIQNGAMTSEQITEKAQAQAKYQLDTWVNQGIIKQTEQYYLFYIQLDQGKLSINAQTIMRLGQR